MNQKLTQPEEVDLVMKGIARNDLKVESTGHDKKNLGLRVIVWVKNGVVHERKARGLGVPAV